jgi:TRAP-type C4-dicarboxylate transport system substrate-binding protein
MKTAWAWAALLAATVSLSVAHAAEKWDMPMAYPDGNFHTKNGVQFAKDVTDATNGDLEIVVHANGSLFKGNDIKRAVQTGQAPIGERLLSAHENENPLFGFDAVPFVATSFAESDKLWKAARPELEKLLASQNLVLLYAVPWPPQGLYSKKKIDSAADMKGVKFRAYNAATAKLADLMGAVPVQIEAAELSQALATGVAESFISSGSTGYDSKVWEQLDYFYDVQAWLPRNYVFANKQAWDALPEATRQIVLAKAAEAEARGTAEAERLTGWYLEQLQANGMTAGPPSPELKKDLAGYGDIMAGEWLKKAGAPGQAIIDAYKKM